MSLPLMFNTHEVLDALAQSAEEQGRLAEMVADVAIWAIRKADGLPEEEDGPSGLTLRPKATVIGKARNVLRYFGKDICDSKAEWC